MVAVVAVEIVARAAAAAKLSSNSSNTTTTTSSDICRNGRRGNGRGMMEFCTMDLIVHFIQNCT